MDDAVCGNVGKKRVLLQIATPLQQVEVFLLAQGGVHVAEKGDTGYRAAFLELVTESVVRILFDVFAG